MNKNKSNLISNFKVLTKNLLNLASGKSQLGINMHVVISLINL